MVSNTGVCTLCNVSIDNGETRAKLDVEKQSALKRAVSVVLRLQLEDSASVCISCAENVVAVEQRMGRWVGNLYKEEDLHFNFIGGSTLYRLCAPNWSAWIMMLDQKLKFKTKARVFTIALSAMLLPLTKRGSVIQ